MANPVEVWKSEKHGLDVWPDVERYAAAGTPMKEIDTPDLERMKWHGFFYRKRDDPGRYMARVRITAGELTAAQAKELALIAYEFGHEIVDITTRANLQIQGLDIANVPKVAGRMERVGLTAKQTGHDNIRNVFAHPYQFVFQQSAVDTRQLCHEITELFIDSREYSDLPRKFNICLNGTDQHSAHFWTQDLSLLAVRTDHGEVMFQALVGGTQGQNPHLAWHLPVLIKPEQAVKVTRSLLDLFRAKGSREKRNHGRFRYLMEEIGVAGVLEWLADDLPFALLPYTREPAPACSHDELIGWFRQADRNLWTMGLLGRMTWQQLEGLALLSKRWGSGELRTTHEQGIAVINIPGGFRDAAATDAAALGLSIHASPLELNTIACTGSQFCNIAVTETKGHMFKLIEALKTRALMLHGIRIHMSGCPSSCAQHFTADIGLKGVRVRRLLGTREGFDVILGGGLAGQVHMGLPYKLGVDVDQLPTLIDEVVNEYYLKHRAGQTFSAYWREVLQAREADKVGDHDYQRPIWVCECCNHHHTGEDPPVFCPRCAGLRRYFARLDDANPFEPDTSASSSAQPAERSDGFVFAADDSALTDGTGLTVEVRGNEYALFRENGKVFAIDSACPHEGAQLADGEFKDGVVSCPWHDWKFDACTGCSLEPAGHQVTHYETLVEDGKIYLQIGPPTTAPAKPSSVGSSAAAIAAAARGNGAAASKPKTTRLQKPVQAELPVLEVIDETPDVRTFRLDNREAQIPRDVPGRFVKVGANINGEDVWRSFTIASAPTTTDCVDLTIKLNPEGKLSRYLFENVKAGDKLRIKGPQGGFFFDPLKHPEPLVLISAGSGITPMMSIVRYLQAQGDQRECRFLFGARSPCDIIFHDECRKLADESSAFQYFVTLSQPNDDWSGSTGRLGFAQVAAQVPDLKGSRYYICGPNDFMESLVATLRDAAFRPIGCTPSSSTVPNRSPSDENCRATR